MNDLAVSELQQITGEVPSTGESKTVDEMTVRELREVKTALTKTQRERDRQVQVSVRREAVIRMDLSAVRTADLVQELSRREGVKAERVEPYRPYDVTINGKRVDGVPDCGPVVLMVIWD